MLAAKLVWLEPCLDNLAVLIGIHFVMSGSTIGAQKLWHKKNADTNRVADLVGLDDQLAPGTREFSRVGRGRRIERPAGQ